MWAVSLWLVRMMGYGVLGTGLNILPGIGVTYLVALLSWNCLEKHFLKIKNRALYKHVELHVEPAMQQAG